MVQVKNKVCLMCVLFFLEQVIVVFGEMLTLTMIASTMVGVLRLKKVERAMRSLLARRRTWTRSEQNIRIVRSLRTERRSVSVKA